MKTNLHCYFIALALFAGIYQANAQNLLVGDSTGITQVTPSGVKSPFAPGLTGVGGMTFDGAGNLFVVSNSSSIVKITPDGTQSIFVSSFTNNIAAALGLAFDSATNLYVANYAGAGSIIKITPNGTQTVFADSTSGLEYPLCLAFNNASNLFVANKYGYPGAILEFNPSGMVSIFAQSTNVIHPCGVAFDSKGNLFVSSDNVNGIYEIMTNGSVSTFFPAYSGLNQPEELAFDNAGNLYEADLGSGKIYEFTNNAGTLSSNLTLFASGFNNPQSLVFQPVSVIPFYYITNNSAIAITGYAGSGGAVTIPSTINGYPVTSIFDGGNTSIPGVNGITSLIFPNSVTNIGNYAFENCAGLTNVLLGNGVITIGNFSFSGCGITSITIPGSVTSIGNNMLFSCTSLTSVTISASVTSIGVAALYDCTSLTNIIVDGANLDYSSLNGVLFDKTQTTVIQFPAGLGGSYTIPNSVTSVGAGAFIACDSLTNVNIPNSVTSIGGSAFDGCSNLKSVYFLGNAPTPSNDTSVFFGDSSAVAYYLQGATGWGQTFDGIPAQISLPPPPALGISTYGSQPAVFFPTATGTNYVLQMTTNLANGPWVTVSNGVPISGIIITNPPAAAFFRLH